MNKYAIRATRLLAAFSILLLLSSAQAQGNELENPGFDVDLAGWDVFDDRPRAWSEEDADGSAESGSALLGNVGNSNGNVPLVLNQCIQVDGDTEYQFGAEMFVPEGQPPATTAFAFVLTFSSADCTGNFIQNANVSSNLVGEWSAVDNSITTGSNIQSVVVGLGVAKQIGNSDDAEAHFDNIYLLRITASSVEPSKSASWFNPDEPGHGIMVHLLNSTDAWMCWFTFDLNGNRAWICALGTISGDTITFDEAFQVDGGAFPPNFDPEQIVETAWGSITVQFTGCNSGTLTWTTEEPGFQSGSMPLTRLTDLWGANCN